MAEVGRAYKRATENKQEAELMARKVGCRGAGGQGRVGWAVEGGTAPGQWRCWEGVCSSGLCPCCARTGACSAWGGQVKMGCPRARDARALQVPGEASSTVGGQRFVPGC